MVAHQLQELSTSELAAELYRRLCVGRLGEPGPFKGTMLDSISRARSSDVSSETHSDRTDWRMCDVTSAKEYA